MNDVNPGIVLGIAGGVIGCIGGAIGTYFEIARTKPGPKREFVIKFAIAVWIAIVLFISLGLLLPKPYSEAAWSGFVVSSFFAGRYFNRRMEEFDQSDSSENF
jgi:hypothetical protein